MVTFFKHDRHGTKSSEDVACEKQTSEAMRQQICVKEVSPDQDPRQ